MTVDGANLAGTAAIAERGKKVSTEALQRWMPCDKGTWQLDCTRMFPTSTIILVQWELVIGLNKLVNFCTFSFSKAEKNELVWTLTFVFYGGNNVLFFLELASFNCRNNSVASAQCICIALQSTELSEIRFRNTVCVCIHSCPLKQPHHMKCIAPRKEIDVAQIK